MYIGKIFALTLFIIARWGTQYRLLISLIRSKDALRRYDTKEDLDVKKSDEKKENHSRMI